MKRLLEASSSNPRIVFDEPNMRLRLICTDCDPEFVVCERDVNHWETMPADMQEAEGADFAVDDMLIWLEHMRNEHGVVPDGN